MIAKGKSISHGAAMMEYAAGREKAEFLCANHMDLDFEETFRIMPDCVWASFKLNAMRHSPVKNSLMRFELSPSKEQSDGWTADDWKALVNEFMDVMDSITMVRVKDKSGKWKDIPVKPTNIKGSQNIAFKHRNTDNPHLHFLVNRIDENSSLNDDAFLLNRAFMAAQIINQRRGWQNTLERSEEIKASIKNAIYDVLRSMPEFSWKHFKQAMAAERLIVKEKQDRHENVVNYRVHYDGQKNSYNASAIDRRLTAAHIEATWKDIRGKYEMELLRQKSFSQAGSIPESVFSDHNGASRTDEFFLRSECGKSQNEQNERAYYDDMLHLHIKYRFHSCDVEIKRSAESLLRNEITKCFLEEKSSATGEYLAFLNEKFDLDKAFDIAVLLFVDYVDAATSMSDSIGGGGSTTTGDWGKKDDEDEKEWIRRCACQAVKMCKPWYLNRRKGVGR